MLGQFTWEDEADRGLDLAGSHSWFLVVASQVTGLHGDFVKNVVNEGVHDGHCLGGDTGIWVDLLQHLVDVDLVGLGLQNRANKT